MREQAANGVTPCNSVFPRHRSPIIEWKTRIVECLARELKDGMETLWTTCGSHIRAAKSRCVDEVAQIFTQAFAVDSHSVFVNVAAPRKRQGPENDRHANRLGEYYLKSLFRDLNCFTFKRLVNSVEGPRYRQPKRTARHRVYWRELNAHGCVLKLAPRADNIARFKFGNALRVYSRLFLPRQLTTPRNRFTPPMHDAGAAQREQARKFFAMPP